MTNTEFNGEQIIDVRDIISRVESLREELSDLESQLDDANKKETESLHKEISGWKEDNSDELETLEKLLSDMCGYGGDVRRESNYSPIMLIREDAFEQQMNDLLEDVGDIPKNLPSYLTVTVDYDALKRDYNEVKFDGYIYYYR